MRRKLGSATLASLLILASLTGCVVKNPDTMPGPGDNVLRIEIHAYAIAPSGTDHLEVRRSFAARVDATNGVGELLLGDDGKQVSNWKVTGVTPLPAIVLSQRSDAGPERGIGVSIKASVQPVPGDKQISIVCSFFVNGVEDLANAQAGQGRDIVCMYRTKF